MNDEESARKDQPKNLDREQVAATLDSEMSRLEQAVTRSGLTTWSLTAALAGVIWLLLSTPELPLRLDIIVVAVIFLSSLQDGLLWIFEFIQPAHHSFVSRVGYYRTRDAYGSARSFYIVTLVRGITLICLVQCYIQEFDERVALILAFTLIVATSGRQLIASWRKGAHVPAIRLIGATTIAEMLAFFSAATYSITGLWRLWASISISEFKTSSLIVAALYLILQLARPQMDLPALTRLREIRRNIGFGRMSTTEAVSQAEEILIGYSPDSLLMPGLRQSIRDLQSLGKQFKLQMDRLSLLGKDTGLPEHEMALTFEAMGNQAANDARIMFAALRSAEINWNACDKQARAYAKRTRGDTHLADSRRMLDACQALLGEFRDMIQNHVSGFRDIRKSIEDVDNRDSSARDRMLRTCDNYLALEAIYRTPAEEASRLRRWFKRPIAWARRVLAPRPHDQ